MSIANYFSTQVEWLKGFLSDPNGKASSKRGISVASVVVFLVAYLKIALATTTLIDIPPTWAVMILGILGLGIYSNRTDYKSLLNGNGNGNGNSSDSGVTNPPTK